MDVMSTNCIPYPVTIVQNLCVSGDFTFRLAKTTLTRDSDKPSYVVGLF